jgi:TetR/AcrR family transcriptional repressor of nem operon
MGRAAKFDREAAIEICMHNIWRNGYEACSVKSISEKLGITRSSFYNAFGSREDLFLEVLTRYAQQTPDRVLESVAPNVSIKRLLTSFFIDVCEIRTADPEARGCLAINCVSELVGVDETLGPLLENAVLNSLQRFESLLKVAANRGELIDDGLLHNKALALQNLLVGISVMAKIIRSKKELEAIVEQTLKGLEIFER